MKFLKFLIVIALLIGAIYWKSNSNETKVYTYFKENQCKNVVLHRSEYKAMCKERVILIADYIFLDTDERIEIPYKDIASVENMGKVIILHNKELELSQAEPRIYFGSTEDALAFQEGITAEIK